MALTSTFDKMLDKVVTIHSAIDSQRQKRGAKRIAQLFAIVCGLSLYSAHMAHAPALGFEKSAKEIAYIYLGNEKQFKCLNSLYIKESNWRIEAENKSVTPHAYGIPQLRNQIIKGKSAETQIIYGLKYIAHRYGLTESDTPNACRAYSHFKKYGWH